MFICARSISQEYTKRKCINMHNIPVLKSAAVQSFGAAPGGYLVGPAASQEPGQLIALKFQHPPAGNKSTSISATNCKNRLGYYILYTVGFFICNFDRNRDQLILSTQDGKICRWPTVDICYRTILVCKTHHTQVKALVLQGYIT